MMLYVAVEGHHPMHRSSTIATLAAILEEDVPPPRRADALGPVLRSVLIKDVASGPTPSPSTDSSRKPPVPVW